MKPGFGWILIAMGFFTFVAAATDWDWYMRLNKVQFFVNAFGRKAARWIFALAGIGIVIAGIVELVRAEG